MDKTVIMVNRQLKKDEIVDKVSRMVKDHDAPVKNGMTEIANRWITELDTLLFELQNIENQLNTPQ